MYKSSGLGTGKGSFPPIQISHAAVGFQCAELRSDDNCDTCNFGRFHIKGCGVGFRVKNEQGVAYSFAYAKFDDTGVCFDFEAGGPLDVQHLHGVRNTSLAEYQRRWSVLRLLVWFHHLGCRTERARGVGEAHRDGWSGSLLRDYRGRSRGHHAEPRPNQSPDRGVPDGAEVRASSTECHRRHDLRYTKHWELIRSSSSPVLRGGHAPPYSIPVVWMIPIPVPGRG